MDSRRILLVEPDPRELRRLLRPLDDVGHATHGVETFEAAKRQLDHDTPDLLITNSRLGAFNGLHLVIWSTFEHPQVSAAILDPQADPVLRAQTEQLGAVYRAYPIDAVNLVALSAIDQPLGHWTPVRRWPRIKPVSEVGVQVAQSGRRITDLSYGGIRFAASPDRAGALPDSYELRLPCVGMSIDAETVWVTPDTPSGDVWFGAKVSHRDPRALDGWRRVVDAAAQPTAS